MSITMETVNTHLNDPAIFCCQRKKGIIIGADDLEDPTIIPDLVDSGLLILTEQALTISQVLGKKLLKDCEALTPIIVDMIEGAPAIVMETDKKEMKEDIKLCSIKKENYQKTRKSENEMIHISVDKLEGISLDIPANLLAMLSVGNNNGDKNNELKIPCEDKVIRSLEQKKYKVTKVLIRDKTSFTEGVLTIDKKLVQKAKASNELIKNVEMDLITPDKLHIFTNTIMDIIPIATKVSGKIGEGETNILNGAVFCLTGLDENGVQIHEFGSCEGYIDEKIAFNRPGCPDENDIIIRVNVTIQKDTGMERRGPLAAHTACDVIIQEIREVLKKTIEPVEEKVILQDVHRLGRPRVVLVKEIMGQGAMHDNILMPTEPAGILGGQKNVDLGNIPVLLTPNEVRDGGIHALTCIGPSTKEMTRHYFREPLVECLVNDEELDFVGVIFIGSPQVNDEKAYVSQRLGVLIETMSLEGAIVTTEGFGNNHIDFASNIEEIGSRGIPVVGVTFSAYQGQLVVGNKYMDAMIELNKDENGFENEILGCSSICKTDAKRAVMMLKTKMAGISIEPAERKWSQAVINRNQNLVD